MHNNIQVVMYTVSQNNRATFIFYTTSWNSGWFW